MLHWCLVCWIIDSVRAEAGGLRQGERREDIIINDILSDGKLPERNRESSISINWDLVSLLVIQCFFCDGRFLYDALFFRFSSAVFSVNCRECDGELREEGRAKVRGREPPQLQGEPLICRNRSRDLNTCLWLVDCGLSWLLIGRLMTTIRWYEQDNWDVESLKTNCLQVCVLSAPETRLWSG